ncbi:methyltransferase domain-containing protein [uncultured Pseudoteredinibacter sp.]|uniref:methyltransferase domain-containing protein n=1 Tax=uncultured Pseudoteredinibacter sp. TaxID=1641701 RepID=UPI0026208E77|nr:methyltransferase domain-containing protein [uncultured Pseudoteredinibacter sp.]
MNNKTPLASELGLGQALRRLLDLSDNDMDSWYQQLSFPYRARYTPLLRLLANGPQMVGQLSEQLAVTQGAVSQTVRLMLDDGLIEKSAGKDARQSVISLSASGKEALEILQPHWQAMLRAVDQLESELGCPLRDNLSAAAEALELESFSDRVERQKTEPTEKLLAGTGQQNPFSIASAEYQKFRPSYPEQLGQALAELCGGNDVAVDVGCGNGQLSTVLAAYFKKVIAVDNSAEQIRHSQQQDNITYQVGSAESLGGDIHGADLIVAAQAAHWFDLNSFYDEARRVAKPNASIALISYGVPYIEGPLNAIFQQGYWQDCFSYWPKQRRPVENGYADLYFPFEETSLPNVSIEQEMSFEELLGYISTWSAYKAAQQKDELAVFHSWFERLQKQWGDEPKKKVLWPIAARIGKLS